MKNRKIYGLLGIICIIIAVLVATISIKKTGNKVIQKSANNIIERTEEETRSDFEAFLQEIFQAEVTNDSITLNYMLKDAKAYGIEELSPTLGEVSLQEMESNLLVSENWLASLKTFDYEKLSEEQQLIYDILQVILEQNLSASDYLMYSENLGPTTGIQAQLPVLLAEYNFYQKSDVDTYLALLERFPDYFEQIIKFQEEKSENGLFMSDTTAEAIIRQCEEFIDDSKENYLITIFNQKIRELEGLTDTEITEYEGKNRIAIEEMVLPAYQNLLTALESLKGTGKNEAGLCGFEKGREYYTYLVQAKTGSDRSIEEIETLLDKTITETQKEMANIISEEPDAYYQTQEISYPSDNPEEQLAYLQKAIEGDFPALEDDISCSVKYVDESLEESMSPAFYLTTPCDYYKENVIYLNANEKYDLSQAFSTIAHEGYPGHLYQNCYFLSTEPEPIRSVINVTGYSEGWATYAELYSFEKAKLEEKVVTLMKNNTLATLCVYAKADIGINYFGWDFDKTKEYLSEYGFTKIQAKVIFDSMIAEPASYMPYTLGYLEIAQLRQEAEEALGEEFVLYDFHKFVLDIGEAPFSVIQKYFNDWLEEQQSLR